jgi:pilus assembly protein FimV
MPRYLASLSLLLAGLVPFAVGALGLGEIDLKSGLNQPFNAEIEVSSETSNDLQGLEVGLASVETFNQFGVDRAPFLADFDFVVVNENGETRIDITSVQPVVEPFVTLLLEIRWPQGRLLREFTVLLDPPAFAAADVEPALQEPVAGPAPIPAETQIVRTPVPEESAPVLAESTPEPTPTPVPEAVAVVPVIAEPAPAEAEPAAATAVEPTPIPPVAEEPAPAESAPVETAPVQSAAAASESPSEFQAGGVDGTYGPVVRNDTLWSIAGRVAPDDSVDRNQMMLAIYRANPEAFAGNINRLKAGVILRVPEAEELAVLGRIEARNEVQRQEDAWKSGADTGSRLRLVPPPEEATAGSAADQASSDFSSSADATAEQQALQQRIRDLEAEDGDNERLLELRNEEMQALQDQLAAIQQREDATVEVDAPDVAEEPAVEDSIDSEAIVDPFLTDESAVADSEEGLAGDEAAAIDDGAGETADETGAGAEEAVPLPAPVSAVESVPSDVVTTRSTDDEPSLIGGLLTNIWFYVSLFGVLLLALFVVRRRSSEPPVGGWDELRASEPALDGLDGQGEGPAGISEFAGGTPEEATFIVEETPSEPTIQESTVGDLASEVSAELEDDFAAASDAVADVAGVDEGGDLLGDDLLIDHADDDLAAVDDSVLEPDFETESEAEVEAEAIEEPHETSLERTISIASGANIDQADPLAEADFHMAYGLYDQAADLLTEELRTAPERKELRLKLLEVYFIWENAAGFLREAEDIKPYLSGDADPDWNKVLIMGKQICPNEALFSGSTDASGDAGDMDLMLSDDGGSDAGYDVDFPVADGGGAPEADISFEESADLPDLNLSDLGGADDGGLDFDLGADDLDAEELNASTMETPTIESPLIDDGDGEMVDPSASTMETPTVDIAALEPTLESPIGDGLGDDQAGQSTMETPTVDIAALEPTMEMVSEDFASGDSTMETPTVDMPAIDAAADSPLDDLDVTGTEFSEDEAVGADAAPDDEDLLEMSSMDLAAETLQVELDEDTNIRQAAQGLAADDTPAAGEDSITDDYDDIFMDLEPTEVLQRGVHDHLLDKTAEQPGIDSTAEQPQAVGDGKSSTDTFRTLQIAEGTVGQESGMEASTMTEVGTKLDLARAYIDMGDPDGARSILNEVLEEAGDSQRQEAQQLLAGLG